MGCAEYRSRSDARDCEVLATIRRRAAPVACTEAAVLAGTAGVCVDLLPAEAAIGARVGEGVRRSVGVGAIAAESDEAGEAHCIAYEHATLLRALLLAKARLHVVQDRCDGVLEHRARAP